MERDLDREWADAVAWAWRNYQEIGGKLGEPQFSKLDKNQYKITYRSLIVYWEFVPSLNKITSLSIQNPNEFPIKDTSESSSVQS